MLLTVLGVVSGICLFGAAVLSGALLSGREMRLNYHTESLEHRAWRTRVSGILLLVGLATGGLAYLFYRMGLE